MAEEPEDREDLERPPSFFPSELTGDAPSGDDLVEVRIDGVYQVEHNGQTSTYVCLTDGDRRLPIQIGPFEALAIGMPLDGKRADRPMSHDLLRNIIERLGATIDRIAIDDLWNQVFYAKLFLRRGDDEMVIDARPSDAIALAIRFEAPMYVSQSILESSGEF